MSEGWWGGARGDGGAVGRCVVVISWASRSRLARRERVRWRIGGVMGVERTDVVEGLGRCVVPGSVARRLVVLIIWLDTAVYSTIEPLRDVA